MATKTASKTAVKTAAAKKSASKTGKAPAPKQWIYLFNDTKSVAKVAPTWNDVRNLLGGKGAGLWDMTSAGLPVPFGFTITTEVCDEDRKSTRLNSSH